MTPDVADKILQDVIKLEQKVARYEVVLWAVTDAKISEEAKIRLAERVLEGVKR